MCPRFCHLLYGFALLFFTTGLCAQFTELTPLPEPVSNNAVVATQVNGQTYVYSFCGIDPTKTWSGIHLKAWRYDVEAGLWDALPPVPDPQGGKIAAWASEVKGKIYLIGGYHVAANGTETSSDKVHVFDPQTNTWLPDAAPLPTPIDDQVQAVWRDSLIYVITGWSNTTNVPLVQIFNPTLNQWMAGTPVPDEHDYKVFGAAGTIIGDTIYYAGGAKATFNFPPTTIFRKGIIHPANPLEIEWVKEERPEAKGYRMAVAVHAGRAVWLGGSDVTYNFNGIAYNGSGGVTPLARTTVFDPVNGNFFQSSGNMPPVMDLRGAAQINDDEVIIAGGMAPGQQVSDRVWRIQLASLTGIDDDETEKAFYNIFPNPANRELTVELPGPFELEMYDARSSFLFYKKANDAITFSIANLAPGIYWLDITSARGLRVSEKVVVE
ncbi:MAG TPA: T9SS C-terminal target domain-containing protein [Bacteroidetes bacterium]|nr:T9SS C-terminal target domain-containing protein [Bacteroidota bacterium]